MRNLVICLAVLAIGALAGAGCAGPGHHLIPVDSPLTAWEAPEASSDETPAEAPPAEAPAPANK